MTDRPVRYKSKTWATWLALTLGSLGAHRFYLHGRRDGWAWLHPLPTLLGAAGALRMVNLGQDDHAAWLLIPLLGLMLSLGMLAAIIYGLTPDEKWAARFNPGQPVRPHRAAGNGLRLHCNRVRFRVPLPVSALAQP